MINPSERGIARSQLEQAFLRGGQMLAQKVQTHLGVRLAALTYPPDLVLIGLAVYYPAEAGTTNPNVAQLVDTLVTNLNPDSLRLEGTTEEKFRAVYPRLIGHIPGTDEADYATGEIANALKNAAQISGPAEAEALENEFAQLTACYFMLKPLQENSGIRINIDRDENAAAIVPNGSRPAMQIKSPTVVIEYGPGLTAFQKIPYEMARTRQTVLIEANPFVTETLLTGAELHGLHTNLLPGRPPQVIGRSNGMKAATIELLNQGYEEVSDVIISSKTYSAGEEEMEAGIRNGYRLLKRGGVFVVQAIDQVRTGEVSGKTIFDLLRDTFQKGPAIKQPISGIIRGERTRGYNAVFVK